MSNSKHLQAVSIIDRNMVMLSILLYRLRFPTPSHYTPQQFSMKKIKQQSNKLNELSRKYMP